MLEGAELLQNNLSHHSNHDWLLHREILSSQVKIVGSIWSLKVILLSIFLTFAYLVEWDDVMATNDIWRYSSCDSWKP